MARFGVLKAARGTAASHDLLLRTDISEPLCAVHSPKSIGTVREDKLSVATGEDFVGSIRAVDRMIRTAIGNTTNLAARLQRLTRDLAATLVIDCRTWERAQAAAADFEKRAKVAVRGRRETQDVYVLPMRSGS